MKKQFKSLQEALDAATKRKSRKRRYARIEETPTVEEVQQLSAEQAGSSRGDGESALKRVHGLMERGVADVASRLSIIPVHVQLRSIVLAIAMILKSN